MKKKELIESLIEQTKSLSDFDGVALNALKERAKMIIGNIYGESNKGYPATISNIQFYPYFEPVDDLERKESWDSGRGKMLNLLNTILEEITLFDTTEKVNKIQKSEGKLSNRIFMVHGHDEEMKQSVARVLEKLELEPIILHEKPDRSRTIVEKFTEYSNVHFAVVLLSPDDIAYQKENSPEKAKLRARQNVIFELGFFIGKLGREHVFMLHREEENFELPSDYSGVLYTTYDSSGNWKYKLVQELKVIGFKVSVDKLLSDETESKTR